MRRQRKTNDEWKNTVAAQQASVLKISEYCAKYNIHIQTIYARRGEIDKKTVQTTLIPTITSCIYLKPCLIDNNMRILPI